MHLNDYNITINGGAYGAITMRVKAEDESEVKKILNNFGVDISKIYKIQLTVETPKSIPIECSVCKNRGWIFVHNVDNNWTEIQKCDNCEKYVNDGIAVEIAKDQGFAVINDRLVTL